MVDAWLTLVGGWLTLVYTWLTSVDRGLIKAEVNGCHGPRRHPDILKGVFFSKNPVLFVFLFVFFSPKMLFFYIPMTSNAFPRARNMFFKGS